MPCVCIMLTYVTVKHMTMTSVRTSERVERARAEQAQAFAFDVRTAGPATLAHAAALSCKVLACCMCVGKAAEELCCALLRWWRLLLPVFPALMMPSLVFSKDVTVISTHMLLRKDCSRSAPG